MFPVKVNFQNFLRHFCVILLGDCVRKIIPSPRNEKGYLQIILTFLQDLFWRQFAVRLKLKHPFIYTTLDTPPQPKLQLPQKKSTH